MPKKAAAAEVPAAATAAARAAAAAPAVAAPAAAPAATTAEPGEWRYVDGRGPLPPLHRRLFWGFAAFAVAHIFLWPAGALFAVAALAWYGGGAGQLAAAALTGAYALTYLGHAPHTGARHWPAFLRPWIACHHQWKVRVLLWAGPQQGYVCVPVPEHDAVYNTAAKTFIFAMAPHGPIPLGGSVFGPQLSRWAALSSRVRFGVHSVLFALPLLRDFYLAFGCVDASRRTLLHQLRDLRNSVVLLPGGVEEQLLLCPPDVERVVLSKRKGFVRLALETGSDLVPVFVFGEREAYKMNDGPVYAFSLLLRRLLGIGAPLPRGRWWTLAPFPVPITIVVGKPIPVARVDGAPTPEAVDALHGEFVSALRDLVEEHKAAAGKPRLKLEVL
jgi:1-acyl-sn-glycerol-3-phosphate acyltransferase